MCSTHSVFFIGFFQSMGIMLSYDAEGLPVDAPLYANGDCYNGPPPL